MYIRTFVRIFTKLPPVKSMSIDVKEPRALRQAGVKQSVKKNDNYLSSSISIW
jgi:hypothetical protein